MSRSQTLQPTGWFMGGLVAAALLCGCSLSRFAQVEERSYETISCATPDEATATIYVDSLGWHTGIVLSREDAEQALGAVLSEFGSFPWVEIGWGDRDFYMASGYSYWAGLQALFLSGGSAIHAAGFQEAPEKFFDRYQLIRIAVARSKLPALFAYIRDHLALDKLNRSTRLGKSLYGEGSFYAGKGSFSLWHTCNSWTADALVQVGCRIDPELTRASRLVSELRKLPPD